ncbi:MAG: hypothetical protein AB7S41_19920 [Parvibaculaceae bacterium]
MHEIAATLSYLWARDYDAVLIRNYTSPETGKKTSILVVKDPSQLRTPWAAFDPARRDSNDLLSVRGLPFPHIVIEETPSRSPYDDEEFQQAYREGRAS